MAAGSWSTRATTLWLYYHTLRHLSPGQVANRAARAVRRRVPAPRAGRVSALPMVPGLPSPLPGLDLALREGPWTPEFVAGRAAGAGVMARRFTFLGQSEYFAGRALSWNDPAFSQLWRYHLHYFDYVLDLAAAAAAAGGETQAAAAFAELAGDWIAANPEAKGDGWHPYTVSRRIVNWLLAARLFAGEPAWAGPGLRIEKSIAVQARYLARNLELDVRGNHLIANLRGLLCAGLWLAGEEARSWKESATRRLRAEVAEQVLPDGGHFERNPGYHLVVLRDLLDLAIWWRQSGEAPPSWLTDAIRGMLEYLAGVLPPTGELPLVKDTAWDEIPDPGGLIAAGGLLLGAGRWKRSDDDFSLYPALLFGAAGWEEYRSWPVAAAPTSAAFRETGHYVLRDDRRGDFLFFDAGEPCPPYLPAHAHADLLSYELTVGGRRVVVDSGVYEYAPGSWRNYFRSTRAHSTVEVAGQDQSEVWSSFRTARRAHPSGVLWQPEGERVLVGAEHDGYARLRPPVIHRRTIAWEKGGYWLFLDQLFGSGGVAFAGFVHLDPSLSLRPAGALTWRVEGLSYALWLSAAEGVSAELVRGRREPPEQGWQSERFGELAPNQVLVLRRDAELPAAIAYAISLDEPVTVEFAGPPDRLQLKAGHRGVVHGYPVGPMVGRHR
jgi:Heparinase II/III-like protein/Heparinase II/III N-terminus